jgi:hypothetical protein
MSLALRKHLRCRDPKERNSQRRPQFSKAKRHPRHDKLLLISIDADHIVQQPLFKRAWKKMQ